MSYGGLVWVQVVQMTSQTANNKVAGWSLLQTLIERST